MTQFSAYIFRQTLWPTLFFLVVLAGVVWLSQGLRMLDMVVNRGQTAGTFLELAIYLLPSLLTIVLPISLFCATLYTLNRLYTDSEVVVMWSAGLSRWSITTPIVALSLILTLIGYFLSLYLMPLGYRAMKDKVYEIRADIATGLFREGAFTYPSKGLAVFVREVTQDGELKGIFIQDTRSSEGAGTYMAASGRLVRTARGPMLIMHNGTLIRRQKQAGDNPIFIQFAEHQYLPEELGGTHRPLREYNERFLPELLHPNMKIPWERQNRGRLISEGYMRLATPLYNIALPMIGVALLLCGTFSRRGFGMRIIAAVCIAILVRVAGVGAHGIVQKHLSLAFLHFLIPLGTVGICALFIGGFSPGALIERLRKSSPRATAGAK